MTTEHEEGALTLKELMNGDDIARAVHEAITHSGPGGMTEEEVNAFAARLMGVVFDATCLDLWQAGVMTMGYDVQEDSIRWYADDVKGDTDTDVES